MDRNSQNLIELKVETKDGYELTSYEKAMIVQINRNMDAATDTTGEAGTNTGSAEIAYLEKLGIVNGQGKLDMGKLMEAPKGSEQNTYKVFLQNLLRKLKAIKIEGAEIKDYSNPPIRQMRKDGVLTERLKAAFKKQTWELKEVNNRIVFTFKDRNGYTNDVDITQKTFREFREMIQKNEDQSELNVPGKNETQFVKIKGYGLPLPGADRNYGYNVLTSELKISTIEEPLVLKVNQMNELFSYEYLFSLGSSKVNKNDPYVKQMLEKIKKDIHLLEGKKVILTGYVDNTPNAQWDNDLKNNTLDLNRANAIKKLLVEECGLKGEQIIAKGGGVTDEFTVGGNTSFNRRVVMRIE